MAKPIRATPTLNSKESKEFVKQMVEVASRPPTKTDKFFIEAISANK